MTKHECLKQAEQALRGISDAPLIDAQRLLLHVLKQKETAGLYAHGEEELNAKQQAEFDRMVAERATGKPLAYVLGEWEFYGQMFYVDESVLVPRPSTEELIEAALQCIDTLKQRQDRVVVADVGTGSGIIAIILALEFTPTPRVRGVLPLRQGEKGANEDAVRKPLSSLYEGEVSERSEDGGVKIIAIDLSPAALAVATKNARRYDVESKIDFLQGDMLVPLRDKKIDLIVSNPPYVPTAELNQIPHPVWHQGLKFEPHLALDGGEDGQRYIQQIAASGIPALVEGTGGKILKFNV